MSSAEGRDEAVAMDDGEKKLQDIFLEGWNTFEELDQTTLPFNSTEFQSKVKASMGQFETATRIVSQVGMFSPNEMIDEVSTDSLQYLLLPFFLGKLALKLNREDRMEVLNISEIYFKDYLQRCGEYELCETTNNELSKKPNASSENGAPNELAELLRAAHSRNDKIAQFRRKKELEEHIKSMKEAVKNKTVDDEVKREFFLKFLKKGIIDANEELDSIKLEKQMVEMRKMHMSSAAETNNVDDGTGQPMGSQFRGSSQHHSHSHHHHHSHNVPREKPKPLQPFIITRNAAQKAVFGAGYPSLPVMTVGEFYQERVDQGIFPDEEQSAKMNAAQMAAALEDPNEKEDRENAVVEVQVENDDPEYLARMRRMDEYKDVVRRGDGNRYNRS